MHLLQADKADTKQPTLSAFGEPPAESHENIAHWRSEINKKAAGNSTPTLSHNNAKTILMAIIGTAITRPLQRYGIAEAKNINHYRNMACKSKHTPAPHSLLYVATSLGSSEIASRYNEIATDSTKTDVLVN